MDATCTLYVREFEPICAANSRSAQYYDVPQKLPDGRTKNPKWLARRTEQSGSICASLVSMSPYRDDSPELVYLRLTGELKKTFESNIHTLYGERNEPRIRAIGEAVLGVRILETGLFRDRVRRHVSVSLDGETNAVRLVGYSDAWPSRTERVVWTLGKCIWEAKASRMCLKSSPQIPHIMQVMLQMYVRHRRYAFLHYWHRDQTRIWLVRFSDDLWRWMVRRLDLMHQHAARHAPVTANNMYFPWFRSPSMTRFFPGATTADYLMLAWFDVDPYPPKTMTPSAKRAEAFKREPPARSQSISYAHWVDTLATMRINPGAIPHGVPVLTKMSRRMMYWLSDVEGGSESAPHCFLDADGARQSNDVAQQTLPPKPEIWLVYDYARQVPMSEVDLIDLAEVAPHDPADIAWFRHEFASVGEYAEHMLSLPDYDTDAAAYDEETRSYPPARHLRGVGPGGSRMRHLFVERFESVPELDEPDPVDQSDEDSAEEHREYERRLCEELQRMNIHDTANASVPSDQRGAKRNCDTRHAPDDMDSSEHAVKRACDVASVAATASDALPPDEPMSPLIMHM